MSEIIIDANDEFYKWEVKNERHDLSDHDREMWCAGFAVAITIMQDLKREEVLKGVGDD